MKFQEDEEKEKDPEILTGGILGEVLDEDSDEDEAVPIPLEDDEKAWE